MRLRPRPLLAAFLFGLINAPTMARSQAVFDTSNAPTTSVSTDYLTGNFTFSLADMGAVQSSGSVDFPGLGPVSWQPGTRPEDLFTVGMMSEFGFQNLSIDQIGATTGQPLSQAALSSFPLVQNLTVPQLVQAIPGLAQTPLNQAPPIAALAQQQGLEGEGDGTVGGIAYAIQGPISQLGGQLVNYGISQIPGLSSISLSNLPGIDTATISEIPGLSQFPLFNPLSIRDWFVPFDIGFGMSTCSMGGDCHERNIDNTASGNMQNMSIPCMGATQSCAHIEVRRNGSKPTEKSRWISKEQQVSGGSGLGAAICGKEPTGRFPLGPNPKVVLEKIDEKGGQINFALYFSVHVGLDGSDSAHCFGPFPMPFFGSAKEGQWILFGPDTVPQNSPFASIGQQSGFSPECAQAPAAQGPPDTSYGHKAYSEAKQSDLVSVPTNPSLNRPEVLQKDAATAFGKMQQAAAAQGIDLNIVSGFRSVAVQKQLWDAQVAKQGSPEAAAKISAPPGYSEHSTGYAVDIGYGNTANLTAGFENTPAYSWLSQNAAKYGFVQSFTKTSTIGADNEPWHWRFEGTPQAKQTFSAPNANATASSATVQQSGGCSGDYGGSCVTSDGKTSAIYKGVNVAAFKQAISVVESLGSGGYSAIGSYVDNDGAGNHGRALGKYQFMSYGPARSIVLQKPGGQDFLNRVDSPSANIGQLQALTAKFLTPQEQETLMDSQIRHLTDLATGKGLQGNALIKRMAEMHTGGDAAPLGVDDKYSDRVVDGYKSGGCVAGSGTSTGKLHYPVDPNTPITSPFGLRRHPVTGEEAFHGGVDFGSGYGTPIHAADGGVVQFAGWDKLCGNMVTIDHRNGFTTTYCHMSQLKTATGTPVSAGQVIGLVGSTGRSTGPHLHFGVRKNGHLVDPMLYLGR